VNRVALACRGRFTTLLGNQGDTWEWDGTVWSRVAPPNPSLARTGHGLVFDSRRRRTVLYGGSPLSDTWEWNGSTWTQVAVPGPPARYFHGMAYDSARGRVVAYGGQPQGGGNALAETWEWDGTTWTQLFPARSPGPRMGCAMAQRSPSGRVLLHAGALDGWGRSPLADTWEWDGTSWTQVVTAPSPGTRSFHAMTYDPDRRLALLYGGAIPPPPGSGPQMQVASDLWEFSDRFGPAGPGQPAGGALPITFTPPRIGTSFCVSFSDPPPTGAGFGILLVASGTPLQPPAVLNPPGVCAVAYLHLLPQAAFMVYGDPAVFCLPIPPNPALAGQLFTLQGAALEVGVCFRLTDALAGEILM
jgi:hypothetical protein